MTITDILNLNDTTTTTTAVDLIQNGAQPDPTELADALTMDEKEFRKLLAEIAPEDIDEEAWVVLLSPGLLPRTNANLRMISSALLRSRREAKDDNPVAYTRWKTKHQQLLDAIGARQAQAEWARVHHTDQRRKGVGTQLNAAMKTLNDKRKEATTNQTEFTAGQLDVIDAVKAAVAAAAGKTANQ